MEKIKKTFKKFLLILNKPELKILPGQIAFNLLMSFVPILLLLSFVAGIVIKNFDLLSIIENNLPAVFGDIIRDLVNIDYSALGLVIIFYIILGLNGPLAIIYASNALYDVKQPNFIVARVKALVMIFIIILLMVFMIAIPVFGDLLFKYIFGKIYISKLLYKIVKLLLSFIYIFINIKLLYVLAPTIKVKSSNTTFGALFTSISWIIVTEIFAFYITNIAKYDVLYGNFANILILLTWIYFLSYFFVLGMAININKYQNN